MALIFISCNPKPAKRNNVNTMNTLQIMRKEIDLASSQILYDSPVTDSSLKTDWTVHHSEWQVKYGWLTGKNPDNAPGMIILKKDFPGNVMVEFEARTILPSTHDINLMWNGEWIDSLDQRGHAYIAGLEGWWTGKIGIEKSPDYRLNAATPLFDFVPGRIYKMLAGSIDGHIFVFVNGKLLLELTDPNPINNQKYAKVGFEAYASHIQLRNIKIYQVSWKPVEMKYEPEF